MEKKVYRVFVDMAFYYKAIYDEALRKLWTAVGLASTADAKCPACFYVRTVSSLCAVYYTVKCVPDVMLIVHFLVKEP